jgi:carboxyl-terminal processing protease
MLSRPRRLAILALAGTFCLAAAADEPDYPGAARALDAEIQQDYAYLDKLDNGRVPQSAALDARRAAVRDARTLLAYAEVRLFSLADHHAITGSSFRDSWAVVPTYADLWVVTDAQGYRIDAVRADSPAAGAGIKTGDRLVEVDGTPIEHAVASFWNEVGTPLTRHRAAFAARILAAGRRDRARNLTILSSSGQTRALTLPSLHSIDRTLPPLTVLSQRGRTVIRFNNSLGDAATIAAFDQAMARVPAREPIVLDLRETPSGGNTTVARALMGWFVDRPRAYQIHNRPAEERQTGIARQWIEQVLPRPGKYRSALPTLWVGRWTGSMGEGIAIGFAALGADVRGTPMAQLNGSIEDVHVGNTSLTIKLPTERLMSVSGQPRERFVPKPL